MESNTCAVMKLNYEDVYKREQEVLAKESDEDFTFRILQRDDFKRGHLQTLAQLTQVGNPTQQDYEARFDEMFPKYADHYRNVVIVDKKKDKIVGSGTVFIEKKFLRECGIRKETWHQIDQNAQRNLAIASLLQNCVGLLRCQCALL
eukprot:403343874